MPSFEERIKRLDDLIVAFTRYATDYPQGTYGDTLCKLRSERAELAATLGNR